MKEMLYTNIITLWFYSSYVLPPKNSIMMSSLQTQIVLCVAWHAFNIGFHSCVVLLKIQNSKSLFYEPASNLFSFMSLYS